MDGSEATLRCLFDAVPDAVVGLDADDRIVLANAGVDALFGWSVDQLVGQRIDVLLPDRTRTLGVAGRRADGTSFPSDIVWTPIEPPVEGLVASVVIRDATDRVDAEADRGRIRAQAERERLDALGQLAGGIAHDFNNLLGVILNYGSFVGEEVARAARGDGPSDWTTVAGDVEQIRRAADRATHLVHQLVAFARRDVVRPEVLSINGVIRRAEEVLRRTVGDSVQLVLELSPSDPPVLADQAQIEQVLANLAANARDAMPSGGTFTIDTDTVFVDEDHAALHATQRVGRHVRLRVSDTGVGMNPDVTARAFEPFFTTRRGGGGSGLGLATVYGIVRQWGGQVTIYSEPGLGTTLAILLPATDDTTMALTDQPAPQPASAGRGETVLLVDDEEPMRVITQRMLTRNGFRVVTASSGADALASAEAHSGPIDVLLTDVVMPGMPGTELAERLTALRPGVRVLFMSGYARPVLGAQGTLEPGLELLAKPFSEEALLARLRGILT